MGNYVSAGRYGPGYRKNDACNRDEKLRNEITDEICSRKWVTCDPVFAERMQELFGCEITVVEDDMNEAYTHDGEPLSRLVDVVVLDIATARDSEPLSELERKLEEWIEYQVDCDEDESRRYYGM